MKTAVATVVLLLVPGTTLAHRLDEYLQGTLISVEKDRMHAEITLTPGIAVLPIVLAEIDTNGDGVVSENEEGAYAARLLRDLSLTIDGHPLTPELVSVQFRRMDLINEGLGQIRIEFQAALPRGGRSRRLVFENRHQNRIGAYLVNCLVPRDPDIQVAAQRRNYSQSLYELDYFQAGVRSDTFSWWPGDRAWLGTVALLLLARFGLQWRKRATAGR
jgi:hypothetical protein